MTLVLTITNVERLENGLPTRLRLDRHGAVIGRSPTADWSLPDPQHYISSVHCEIDYRDGAYVLNDKSTNGTFVNGDQARMSGPHPIASGDVIVIGHYSISAQIDGAGAAAAQSAPAEPEWSGWQPQAAAASIDPASWDRPPPAPAISGQGAMSQNWTPPPVNEPAPASAWSTPAPPVTPASAWSSPVSESTGASSAADVWGQLAASNVVDWARGGFGAPAQEGRDPLGLAPSAPRLRQDPFGLEPTPQPSPAAPQPTPAGWGRTPSTPPVSSPPAAGWGPQEAPSPAPVAQPQRAVTGWGPQAGAQPAAAAAPAPASVAGVDAEVAAFMVGAGLQPSDLKVSGAQALTTAGSAMRRMVAGLVVMLEARARAKAQLGAQGTSLEFEGNNPLKFARSPEKAVAQLLNPPERGFMSSDRAIEDAFRDLQAHQMATLQAMQGALQATLARFSPQAIRERAETHGVLAKILPNAREATLWETYEREFEGVAKGSDEAFMDVFAKEFRAAYERVAAEMKRKA
ncbi:MAG TPA: type VI secretion system-associated FHA domain protein TagH [Caulobacteraceae bacterium]|nr:type VI secretion system-associated FHA domain protein TagH [Caulobacteraceae bacterium]